MCIPFEVTPRLSGNIGLYVPHIKWSIHKIVPAKLFFHNEMCFTSAVVEVIHGAKPR